MAVWGGLTNSCEKKRSKKQRRKGKTYTFEQCHYSKDEIKMAYLSINLSISQLHSICYTHLPLSLVPPPLILTSNWLINSLLFQYTIKEKSYSPSREEFPAGRGCGLSVPVSLTEMQWVLKRATPLFFKAYSFLRGLVFPSLTSTVPWSLKPHSRPRKGGERRQSSVQSASNQWLACQALWRWQSAEWDPVLAFKNTHPEVTYSDNQIKPTKWRMRKEKEWPTQLGPRGSEEMMDQALKDVLLSGCPLIKCLKQFQGEPSTSAKIHKCEKDDEQVAFIRTQRKELETGLDQLLEGQKQWEVTWEL